MTITLELFTEQEKHLRTGAVQHDPQIVREVLLQAIDSPTLLDEAVSRAGIYADHP